uniref:HK1b2 n=1 Tax=Arundo donax TaxID=35708 RepID=A0A0A9GAU5_ARUDO
MSMRQRSNLCGTCRRARASFPLSTHSTFAPNLFNVPEATLRFTLLSSTTSMFLPRSNPRRVPKPSHFSLFNCAIPSAWNRQAASVLAFRGFVITESTA